MASPASSSAAFAAALVAICILVLLLLRHYLPLRSTPAYILTPVFLSLALPCSIVLLVPIDLATNAVEDDESVARGITLDDQAMLVMWRVAYWLTFCLTWFILPLLGDYADSGHRDPKGRMMDSFRSNIRYQLIVLACAIAVLVYYIIQNGFDGTSIKGTVIALAYAWGLVLAIYLMGHGLVALPRRLFRGASISGRLRQLQMIAPGIHDRLTDAFDELDALEVQVLELRQRKTGSALTFQDWIEELAETSDVPESRSGRAAATQTQEVRVPAVITERYLADLTRKLKRARHKRIRFIEEWDSLVSEATDCQTILDAAGSKRLDFGRSPQENYLHRFSPLTPYTRFLLHFRVIPALRLVLAGVLAVASVCVIWSEIFKDFLPAISIVGLSVVHHPSATEKGKIGFAGQVIAAAWLCYMCAAALLSIREVKVWGNRALVRRHTYLESATWYSLQVAKLTVPLSYNFITFLPRDIYQQTTFHRFLGHYVDFTPLGKAFSAFFPIFILIPVSFAAFGLYGRVKRIAGFGVLDDDGDDSTSAFGTGGWREGKALIDRERSDGGTRQGLAGRVGGAGAASGSLGLSDQASSPTVPNTPYTDTSTPSSPQVGQGASTAGAPRTGPNAVPSPRRQAPTIPAASEEEESSNFFEDFAHRVKNTFEVANTPKLNFNFQKPKWMGGDNNGGGGQSRGPGPLDRLFGGSRDDGQVRL